MHPKTLRIAQVAVFRPQSAWSRTVFGSGFPRSTERERERERKKRERERAIERSERERERGIELQRARETERERERDRERERECVCACVCRRGGLGRIYMDLPLEGHDLHRSLNGSTRSSPYTLNFLTFLNPKP